MSRSLGTLFRADGGRPERCRIVSSCRLAGGRFHRTIPWSATRLAPSVCRAVSGCRLVFRVRCLHIGRLASRHLLDILYSVPYSVFTFLGFRRRVAQVTVRELSHFAPDGLLLR